MFVFMAQLFRKEQLAEDRYNLKFVFENQFLTSVFNYFI